MNEKVAIITDTHWGIRNDNLSFLEHNKKFLDEVFFPEIEKQKIQHIIHLGDLTDRQKYINWNTAHHLKEDFVQPIIDKNLKLTITIGNHDTYWKNSNYVNSINNLYGFVDAIDIIEKPIEKDFFGTKVLLMPWICKKTEEASFDLIKNTDSQILMGHLEISGFEMYKGVHHQDGLDPHILDKFDTVFSGHFHHKSSSKNIHYLGSHAQFTWSDYGDERGFHIFDFKNRELTFVKNPYETFKKYVYDDSIMDTSDVVNFKTEEFNDCYVKVIVRNKNNSFLYDSIIDKLENSGAIDIKSVDDNLHIDTIEADDIINEAEDTITIIKNEIYKTKSGDLKSIEKNMISLYEEALTLE